MGNKKPSKASTGKGQPTKPSTVITQFFKPKFLETSTTSSSALPDEVNDQSDPPTLGHENVKRTLISEFEFQKTDTERPAKRNCKRDESATVDVDMDAPADYNIDAAIDVDMSSTRDNVAAEEDVFQKPMKGPKPYTAAQKRAKLDQNNQRLARERKDPDSRYQAKKLEAREEHAMVLNEGIAAELLLQWNEACERHNIIKDAIAASAGRSSIDLVKAVSSASCSQDGVLSIPNNSELWTKVVDSSLTELFSSIISNSNTNIKPYIGDKLRTSFESDTGHLSRAKFYLRHLSLVDPVECFYRYLCQHPADCVWSIWNLLRLGESLQAIKCRFQIAMAVHFHAEAINILFTSINSRGLPNLDLAILVHGKLPLFYAGTTLATAFHRLDQDSLDGEYTRLTNFTKVNGLDGLWKPIHIPSLDVQLSNSLAARTDRLVSNTEGLLVDLFRGNSLNSSRGGVIADRVPPSWAIDLQKRIISVEVLGEIQDYPLGQEECKGLVARLIALLHDELGFFSKHTSIISKIAIIDIFQNALGVLRLNQGYVVVLDIMKDIPEEAFKGVAGGMWEAAVGRGLQEERHLHSLFHPLIQIAGDLPVIQIAQCIGSTINFWRFILDHWLWYLILLLFLGRYLDVARPILITSSSNPIAAIFYRGLLFDRKGAFRGDEEARASFEAGKTPHNIEEVLPPGGCNYKTLEGDVFIDIQATLRVVLTGPNSHDLALWIPRIDLGSLKYDPSMARYRFILAFFAILVRQITVQTIARRLKAGQVYDWQDGDSVRTWMEETKLIVNKILDNDPEFAQQLATVKRTLLSRQKYMPYLRQLIPNAERRNTASNSSIVVASPVHRSTRHFIMTSEPGAAREIQYQEITNRAQALDKVGLPNDPDHLVPYGMDVYSDEYRIWLCGRKPNIQLSAAARTCGSTPAAQQAASENQRRIGAFNTAIGAANTPAVKAQCQLDSRAASFLEAFSDLIDLGFLGAVKKTEDAWRVISCEKCNKTILAKAKNDRHHCSLLPSKDDRIVPDYFPKLIRLLHAHDLMNVPGLQDLLAEIDLPPHTRMPAAQILLNNLEKLPTDMPYRTVQGNIFLSIDNKDNLDLQLTLAYDLALQQLPNFLPNIFHPPTAHFRYSAWQNNTHSKLTRAIEEEKIISVGFCDNEGWSITAGPVKTNFVHTCNLTKSTRTDGGRGNRNCGTHQAFSVKRFSDLPPDISRRLWYDQRLEDNSFQYHMWDV